MNWRKALYDFIGLYFPIHDNVQHINSKEDISLKENMKIL